MYLFFDTETTGLPKNWKAPITDVNNWPRMVQLAYLMYDNQGHEISSGDFIVKPDGFIIPTDASNIHGITTERARREGHPILLVLREFEELIRQASYLVAHNMSFDEKIVGAEFLRHNVSNSLSSKRKICTMESTTNFCAIHGPYGYKWPTLAELYYKLFRTHFKEVHNAAADIQATAKCFWELKRLGIIHTTDDTNTGNLSKPIQPEPTLPDKTAMNNRIIMLAVRHPTFFWKMISLQYPLSEAQLEQYKDKWDWKMIPKNKTLTWTVELIEKFKDKWELENTDDTEDLQEIVSDDSTSWRLELMKHKDNWDWRKISRNESFPWTIDLLEQYEKHLDWLALAEIYNLYNSVFLSYFDHNLVDEIMQLSVTLDPSIYNSQGDAKYELEDYAGAIADYDKAIALDPEYKWAYYYRGRAKYALKDYTGAIANYDKVIALDCEHKWAYSSRGDVRYALKDYTGAIADYDKVIALDPEYKWAYSSRGDVRYALKDYTGAIADYNKVIALDCEHKWAYYNRGDARYALKDYTGAIADYSKAIALDPEYKWIYKNRGNARYALKDYTGAIADYDKAVTLDSDAYNNRGNAKYVLKDYTGAIADYDKTIALDPEHKWAYHNRGRAKYALRNYTGAIADYDKVIALDPNYTNAYNDRGDAKYILKKYSLEKTHSSYRNDIFTRYSPEGLKAEAAKYDFKNYAEAIADYNKAIALDPNDKRAYKKIGDIEYALEGYAGSIVNYDKVIEIDPKDTYVYKKRGDAKYALKDYTGARTDYDKAITLDPSTRFTHIYERSISIAYEAKDYVSVVKYCNKVITLDPNDEYAYYNRGLAKYALKDYTGAIKDYDKTITLDPEYTWIYKDRGNVKYALKDYTGAIKDYDKILEIDPRYTSAYNDRGNAKYALKNHKTAIQDYKAAISLHPEERKALNQNQKKDYYFPIAFVEAYYRLGIVYYDKGKKRRAKKHIRQAAKMGHEESKTWLTNKGYSW